VSRVAWGRGSGGDGRNVQCGRASGDSLSPGRDRDRSGGAAAEREAVPADLVTPPATKAPPDFLWLLDVSGAVIDGCTQASWGPRGLRDVVDFLSDSQHQSTGSLLSWASAIHSPERFRLHVAVLPHGLLRP